MSDLLPRRGFLRSLAALPLIGGGITLIGSPTRAAVPVTEDLLWDYSQWLNTERSLLSFEMGQQTDLDRHWRDHALRFRLDNPAGRFHQPDTPPPSTRATVVLSTADCHWRKTR